MKNDKDDVTEWSFITYDIGAECAECGEGIRPGQAVGHTADRDRVFHARCLLPSDDQPAHPRR